MFTIPCGVLGDFVAEDEVIAQIETDKVMKYFLGYHGLQDCKSREKYLVVLLHGFLSPNRPYTLLGGNVLMEKSENSVGDNRCTLHGDNSRRSQGLACQRE